eukprot:4337988-Prymnesium_polylepis.1
MAVALLLEPALSPVVRVNVTMISACSAVGMPLPPSCHPIPLSVLSESMIARSLLSQHHLAQRLSA